MTYQNRLPFATEKYSLQLITPINNCMASYNNNIYNISCQIKIAPLVKEARTEST
jgi:hypothetical protein